MLTSEAIAKEKRLPRYIELVRVSSKKQSDADTPEMQRRALDKLRERRPGILVDRIEDGAAGLSGALGLSERPDLQRLAKLAQARAFDELRVYDVDRLTRAEDPRERFAVYGMVQDASAVIVDTSGRETNPSDASGMGELDYYLRTFFASQERKRITRRTMDGRRRCAAQGRSPGAGSLAWGLGWDPATRQFVISDQHAAVVRRIFAEADAGRSVRQIAARLNADGIASPKGCRWRGSACMHLMHRPAYKGVHVITLAGERFEIAVPAIVSPDLWERVQVRLLARQHKPRRAWAGVEALCRGLASCGSCGRPMHVLTPGGRHTTYYRCSSNHSNSGVPGCGARYWPIPSTDEDIWRIICTALNDSSFIRRAAENRSGSSEYRSWEQQAKSCEAKLEKLKKDEIQILRDRRHGQVSDEAARQVLKEIAADRDTVQRSLQVALDANARRRMDADALKTLEARVAALRGAIGKATSFASRRALVEALIPELPGYGIIFNEDGRFKLKGAVDLSGEGPVSKERSPAC